MSNLIKLYSLDVHSLLYVSPTLLKLLKQKQTEGFPGGPGVQSALRCRDTSLMSGPEDPLEKEMAIYSSILAWDISWTEEPAGLQSMGSQKCQTQLSD